MVTMDFGKRQTIAAYPAEPGDLPHGLDSGAMPNIFDFIPKSYTRQINPVKKLKATNIVCVPTLTSHVIITRKCNESTC